MLTWMLSLPLMMGSAPLEFAPAPALVAVQADAYAELVEAYETAVSEWRQAVKDGEFEERKRLRENHPAKAYQTRFNGLLESGDGRALVWMSSNARHYTGKSKAGRAEQRRVLDLAMANHMQADWFELAVTELSQTKRVYEADEMMAALTRISENAAAPGARARALFTKANLLAKKGDKESREAGRALLKQIVDSYEGTSVHTDAKAILTKPQPLQAGMMAPDFQGRTIDGHEFKLSDYRDKVVLLDFYGFW